MTIEVEATIQILSTSPPLHLYYAPGSLVLLVFAFKLLPLSWYTLPGTVLLTALPDVPSLLLPLELIQPYWCSVELSSSTDHHPLFAHRRYTWPRIFKWTLFAFRS